MATTKYEVASASSLLTTELNSLAAAGISALGTEYDNATNLYIEGLFELYVVFGSNPSAGQLVDLYLSPSMDGTNYADGSNSIISENNYIGSFIVRAATTQRIVLRETIKLPPTKFKLHLKNGTSQAFTSSGNTVKMIPIRYASA